MCHLGHHLVLLFHHTNVSVAPRRWVRGHGSSPHKYLSTGLQIAVRQECGDGDGDGPAPAAHLHRDWLPRAGGRPLEPDAEWGLGLPQPGFRVLGAKALLPAAAHLPPAARPRCDLPVGVPRSLNKPACALRLPRDPGVGPFGGGGQGPGLWASCVSRPPGAWDPEGWARGAAWVGGPGAGAAGGAGGGRWARLRGVGDTRKRIRRRGPRGQGVSQRAAGAGRRRARAGGC